MKPQVKCAHTQMMSIDELEKKMHPANENNHSKAQLNALAKVIAKNGQRSPIVVSKKSGFITKGHGRVMAMKIAGYTEAAVDLQEYESDLEELNDRVADNEIARYAEFNEIQFKENLEQLNVDFEELDFEEFGLIDFEIKEDSETTEVSAHNRELNTDEFGEDLEHTCPKCGYEFND